MKAAKSEATTNNNPSKENGKLLPKSNSNTAIKTTNLNKKKTRQEFPECPDGIGPCSDPQPPPYPTYPNNTDDEITDQGNETFPYTIPIALVGAAAIAAAIAVPIAVAVPFAAVPPVQPLPPLPPNFPPQNPFPPQPQNPFPPQPQNPPFQPPPAPPQTPPFIPPAPLQILTDPGRMIVPNCESGGYLNLVQSLESFLGTNTGRPISPQVFNLVEATNFCQVIQHC